VERALTLVATGTLTIATAQVSSGTILIPRTFKCSSGKKSTRRASFSDPAWGKTSRSYAKSARALSKVKLDGIVEYGSGNVLGTKLLILRKPLTNVYSSLMTPAQVKNVCHLSCSVQFFNPTYVFFQNLYYTIASIYLNPHSVLILLHALHSLPY
jgi:hypothetical protein